MIAANSSRSYGSIAKTFHWLIAFLIVGQFVLANIAEGLPLGMEKIGVLARHKSDGILILMLAVLRIAWRLGNTPPPPEASLTRWQTIASRGAHQLLYVLLFALPLSGWLMSSAKNYPVSFFGLVQLPNLVAPSESAFQTLLAVHETLATAMLVIAGVHISAALWHHFFKRDNVLRRMLPFAKPR